MSRTRLVIIVLLGLASAFLLGRRLLAPRAPVVEQRPAPVVKREPPLQADAEGHYVPGYRFTVDRFRFTGFRLRPEAWITFARTTTGAEEPAGCFESVISATTVHLRCDYPQVGIVTIDGRFLTRSATDRLDTPVVSAVVTVRNTNGEILYSARDSFVWHPSK